MITLCGIIHININMGKIVVFGDSISYGKWDSEGGWVARLRKYVDETYNIGKGGNVQVYNMGIPGEVSTRMLVRVELELRMRIEQEENNLVIFAIGTNDSCPNNWMTKEQTPPEAFKQAIISMVTIAQKQNCKVACVGLIPVNPAKSKGLLFTNEEVKKYDGFIAEVCQEMSIPKLDLFDELMQQNFPELLVDAAHPNNEGHNIMAEKIKMFLDQQNLLSYCRS